MKSKLNRLMKEGKR